MYLIPAFSGLGAPYWDSSAKAGIIGMTRTTGKNEIIRASLECIAYQIRDVVDAMYSDAKMISNANRTMRVDGGPTKNDYLMQFQSDILAMKVEVSQTEELSGTGVAWAAGLAMHIYNEDIFHLLNRSTYVPHFEENKRNVKYKGWKKAVNDILDQN